MKVTKATKGDWVRIYKVILTKEERSDNLPEDTRQVPLEMWDKGFLLNEEAAIGDKVEIKSIIGRKVEGQLIELAPIVDVNYGNCVTETLYIGQQLRGLLDE